MKLVREMYCEHENWNKWHRTGFYSFATMTNVPVPHYTVLDQDVLSQVQGCIDLLRSVTAKRNYCQRLL